MRRVFGAFGILVVLAFGAFTVAFGLSDGPSVLALLRNAAMMLGGALWAVAGFASPERLASYAPQQLFGVGFVAFGVGQLFTAGIQLQGPPSNSPVPNSDLLLVLTSVALALIFAFIGVDYLRGGVHTDVSRLD